MVRQPCGKREICRAQYAESIALYPRHRKKLCRTDATTRLVVKQDALLDALRAECPAGERKRERESRVLPHQATTTANLLGRRREVQDREKKNNGKLRELFWLSCLVDDCACLRTGHTV